MAKRLVNGVLVEEPDNEETKATEPLVQETEVDANVEEGSQQGEASGINPYWQQRMVDLSGFGIKDNTTIGEKQNLSPLQNEQLAAEAIGLDMPSVQERLAEQQQSEEDALKADAKAAQEARAAMEQADEDAFQKMLSTFNQQAEEAKPQYTEEELQRYSRANTGFASMLSAIANVANVGNVAKGGYAAVVPDGYKVAKAQWDQIKKDERARKRYYDQLKGQIANYEYTREQAKYKKFTDQLNAEQKHLWDMEMQKAKSEADLKKMEAEWGYKFSLAEMNAIIKQNEDKAKHEYEMEEERQKQSGRVYLEQVKTNEKIKQKEAGVGSGSGSDYNIEELRSMTYGPTTYTVPDGTDISDAYSNKVFPFLKGKFDESIAAIDKEISDISTRGSESYMTNEADRNKKITELKNKKAALENKKGKISKIGHGSDAKGRYNAVKDISQYLGELGVTEEEWNGLFSESGSGSGDATDRLGN